MQDGWELLYENPLPGFGNKTGVSYLRASQEVIEICCQESCVMIQQDLNKGIGGVVWDCVRPLLSSNESNPTASRREW